MSEVIIRLTKKQAMLVEKMCDSELHYKIHESGCCHQYLSEIDALLLIMNQLNNSDYEQYKMGYELKRKTENINN